MAGSALGASILAVFAALATGLALAGGAAVTAQRVSGAADAAALAAADTVSGAVPSSEDPCVVAERVAAAAGAALESCTIDGLMVSVQAATPYAGFSAVSRARAGPPEDDDGA